MPKRKLDDNPIEGELKVHVASSDELLLPEGTSALEEAVQSISNQNVALEGAKDTISLSEEIDSNLAGDVKDELLVNDGNQPMIVDSNLMGSHPNLHSLLSACGGSAQLVTPSGETIQIITMNHNDGVITLDQDTQAKENDVILTGTDAFINTGQVGSVSSSLGQIRDVPGMFILDHPLPPGCPSWASRMRDVEKIGDCYRGWVESEIQLDVLLTYHKQETRSFWGTRQSPSSSKPSTRLMWKSQYVPFDGIPFINAGCRAVVMECQHGPRRKGAQVKKVLQQSKKPMEIGFKQTCPARIYIKKVKKFPTFAVDLSKDKKTLKNTMEKVFQMLKDQVGTHEGQERFYVQLPTEDSHEFHDDVEEETSSATSSENTRLAPEVKEQIRNLVASGEARLYVIRKALRYYVDRELNRSDNVIERHNLSYYPTVNDLQNHIHQALSDITAGILPMNQNSVRIDVLESSMSISEADKLGLSQGMITNTPREILVTNNQDLSLTSPRPITIPSLIGSSVNMSASSEAIIADIDSGGFPNPEIMESSPMLEESSHSNSIKPETVTVTLVPNENRDGQHIITRVETHMTDGSTQVSDALTEETAALLAKIHPSMFAMEKSSHVESEANSKEDAELLTKQEEQDESSNKDLAVDESPFS